MSLVKNVSWGHSRGHGRNSKAESEEGVIGSSQPAKGSRGALKGLKQCSVLSPYRKWNLKDELTAQKTRLLAADVVYFLSQLDSAEPLDATGGTR